MNESDGDNKKLPLLIKRHSDAYIFAQASQPEKQQQRRRRAKAQPINDESVERHGTSDKAVVVELYTHDASTTEQINVKSVLS